MRHDFPDWRRLLGEHRWSECFHPQHVPPDAKNRCSRIYYATAATHRQTEKQGWKTRYLFDDDVMGPEIHPEICVPNYPKTHWCATPEVDITNKSWFKQLPVDLFPDRPVAPSKPVRTYLSWSS